MSARLKASKVVASFAFVGLLTAVPPLTSGLFAAAGILAFVVCPASIIALRHKPPLEIDWSFVAYAGPLNAALYAAYGRLLVYLGRQI
jgi:hypothetical protein